MPTTELFTVASYAAAYELGASFLREQAANRGLLVLGPSQGAAADFVRRHCGQGLIGVHALTLTHLAAQCAAAGLGKFGLAPVGPLGLEAVAARVVYKLRTQDRLGYFTPVGDTPGFVKGAARTLAELRLEGVEPAQLRKSGGAPDAALADLLRVFNEQLVEANLADHATLFGLALSGGSPMLELPALALDVPLRWRRTQEFAQTLAAKSSSLRAIVLASDAESLRAWRECLQVEPQEDAGAGNGTLGHVRHYLFSPRVDRPPALDDTLELFSAPSELMECVEIARRAQRLAAQGVAFDRMAVLLRQPDTYQPLLEEALRRAAVPAYFHQGTARPNEGGRAFLALLNCAAEQCSAARFAEYCSLAQVPQLDPKGQPVRKRIEHAGLQDDVSAALLGQDAPIEEDERAASLPAPWRWEELLVDAAVIGGVDRWERRLAGLRNELAQKAQASVDDTERAALERNVEQLRVLSAFAIPLIRMLAALPSEALWGEWLERLRELAETALRNPESVVATLEELQPMADVGPASLEEVYGVLEERLRFLRREPARRRYGQVFVAGVDEARGRWFDVVFVPGLAEGVFPKRAAEDPLLLDTFRANLDAGLTVQDERVARERLLLRAAAAAGASLIVSYPRIDSVQNRPRVPSFYALELLRAAEGALPDLKEFQRQAAQGSPLRLGWPAPPDPQQAVDDAEYDLAVLESAWKQPKDSARGVGRYLVDANPHLATSLRARYKRWRKKEWCEVDGLIWEPELLDPHRLNNRVYSATALERFAACPYRFYLHSIYGLTPRQQVAAIEQMDPKTRGTIFHDLLHELVIELRAQDLLPLHAMRLERALSVADTVVDRVGDKWAADLAPAIPRVWQSELDDLRFDLRGWVRHCAVAVHQWEPVDSELAFGDPPIELFGKVKLRGRVDLVEKGNGGIYRVTDLKTGRKPDKPPTFVGGGRTLQPALYAMALEQIKDAPVQEGRLFYCTHRGGFDEVPIKLIEATRAKAERAVEIIGEWVEEGFLPPAPAEDECSRCDYRLVCGPYEELRLKKKPAKPLSGLVELRGMP